MVTTYYCHIDRNGEPTGPRAKYYGTEKFGYSSLKTAIRWCPEWAVIEERHTNGWQDWGGRIVADRNGKYS